MEKRKINYNKIGVIFGITGMILSVLLPAIVDFISFYNRSEGVQYLLGFLMLVGIPLFILFGIITLVFGIILMWKKNKQK